MRCGIDFDGTIVLYDALFHRLARERFAMPSAVPAAKPAIREWFWSQSDGRERWIELQGLVYGPHMREAVAAPGCLAFLRRCTGASVPVVVISHKTEFPVIGPSVPLREQAMDWLDANGFFARETGLDRERVFFESTRGDKIRRIIERNCTLFIDDLPEVFAEPAFPRNVAQWLYGSKAFPSWDAMAAELEKLLGRQQIQR